MHRERKWKKKIGQKIEKSIKIFSKVRRAILEAAEVAINTIEYKEQKEPYDSNRENDFRRVTDKEKDRQQQRRPCCRRFIWRHT